VLTSYGSFSQVFEVNDLSSNFKCIQDIYLLLQIQSKFAIKYKSLYKYRSGAKGFEGKYKHITGESITSL